MMMRPGSACPRRRARRPYRWHRCHGDASPSCYRWQAWRRGGRNETSMRGERRDLLGKSKILSQKPNRRGVRVMKPPPRQGTNPGWGGARDKLKSNTRNDRRRGTAGSMMDTTLSKTFLNIVYWGRPSYRLLYVSAKSSSIVARFNKSRSKQRCIVFNRPSSRPFTAGYEMAWRESVIAYSFGMKSR